MKRMGLILPALAVLASLSVVYAGGDKKSDGDTKWVQLFNGKDLTGWKTHPADKAKGEGKTTVDFVDEKNRHSKGHFAIQQHDPGSIVMVRKIDVKELPSKKREN